MRSKKSFFFIKIDCKIKSTNASGLAFVIHRNCGKLHLKNYPVDKFVSKKFYYFYYPQKSNYSLFFGSATGVCIQALEEGTRIIHFPNKEEIDVFSNKFWPSLKIKRIGDKIFEYKIIKKNQMFFVKKENEKFKKYFSPLLKR